MIKNTRTTKNIQYYTRFLAQLEINKNITIQYMYNLRHYHRHFINSVLCWFSNIFIKPDTVKSVSPITYLNRKWLNCTNVVHLCKIKWTCWQAVSCDQFSSPLEHHYRQVWQYIKSCKICVIFKYAKMCCTLEI